MRVGKPLPPMPRAPATPIRPPPPCLPPEKGPIPTRRVDRREDSRAVLAVRTMLSPARSDPFTTGHPISLKRSNERLKKCPGQWASLNFRPPGASRPTSHHADPLSLCSKIVPTKSLKVSENGTVDWTATWQGRSTTYLQIPDPVWQAPFNRGQPWRLFLQTPSKWAREPPVPPHSPLSLTGRGLPEDGGRRRHSSASNRGIRRGVLGGYPLHHEARSIGERDHLRVRMSAAL